MWGKNDFGSAGGENVCQNDYRGPAPFSEPETQAMRDFIKRWSNIRIALNLHAWGNLLIHPFNYDDEVNYKLHDEFPKAEDFYQDIE
jgi:carboxypeptidase T